MTTNEPILGRRHGLHSFGEIKKIDQPGIEPGASVVDNNRRVCCPLLQRTDKRNCVKNSDCIVFGLKIIFNKADFLLHKEDLMNVNKTAQMTHVMPHLM